MDRILSFCIIVCCLTMVSIVISSISIAGIGKRGNIGVAGAPGSSNEPIDAFKGNPGSDFIPEDPLSTMSVSGLQGVGGLWDYAFDGTTYIFVSSASRMILKTTNPVDQSKWVSKSVNPLSANSDFRSIAYSKNHGFIIARALATPDDNQPFLFRSVDGNQWTAVTWRFSANAGTIRIAASDTTFVMASANFTGIYVSTDGGVTWTFLAVSNVSFVTYQNGFFVGVGASGTVVYSTDGVNWTASTSNSSGTLTTVLYSRFYSRWIASGTSATTITTPDLATPWTVRTGNFTIIVDNGSELAGQNGSSISRSLDGGVSWTGAFTVVAWLQSLQRLLCVNGLYFMSGNNGMATSTDLTNWTYYNVNISTNLESRFYSATSNGRLVLTEACAGHIFSTTDGVNWSRTGRIVNGSGVLGMTASNGSFFLAHSGQIFTSTDAITWTSVRSGTFAGTPVIAANPLVIIALGADSYDRFGTPSGWTTQTSGRNSMQGVIWDESRSLFLIFGAGFLLSSANGLSWNSISLPSHVATIANPRIVSNQKGTLRCMGASASCVIFECTEPTMTVWNAVPSPSNVTTANQFQYLDDYWFVFSNSGIHYCKDGDNDWYDRNPAYRFTSGQTFTHVASINGGWVFPAIHTSGPTTGTAGHTFSHYAHYMKK